MSTIFSEIWSLVLKDNETNVYLGLASMSSDEIPNETQREYSEMSKVTEQFVCVCEE